MRVKMRIIVSEVGIYKDLNEAKEAADGWAEEIREEYGCDAEVDTLEEES